jgi:uncharacterized protein YndB with AHSA1/START domain
MANERPEPSEIVQRDITIDAPVGEVWEAIRSEEGRWSWLDDDDARSREVRIDDEDAPHRLSWTWWRSDDPSVASRVTLALDEVTDSHTRVTVVEQPVHVTPTGTVRATASAASAVSSSAPTLLVTVSAAAWRSRLVGLELRLIILAAGVAVT